MSWMSTFVLAGPVTRRLSNAGWQHRLRSFRVAIHDLRHSYGSLSLATGTDIVTIGHNMGHSNPRVTASVYLHSSPGRTPAGQGIVPTNTSSTVKRLYKELAER